MTCIVGYKTETNVYIGGDSAGVSDLEYTIREDKKVFKNGKMIFGFTTSFRMGQLLAYSFKIPKQKKSQKDFEYLCTTFADELLSCFTKKCYVKVVDEVPEGGTFLLGYNGNLYMVADDFQIVQPKKSYHACGCGMNYALGAMSILHNNTELTPEQKIIRALEASEMFSAYVRGPFSLVRL